MKKILLAAAALLTLACCTTKKAPVHPEWTYDSVVYEVNIRQFSPEGTFKAVEAQLPRLKDLGVDVLWLMPMYQIGEVERKGSLGSYYAISDYKKVNPEFGTMEDFQSLLDAAHKQGFKLILDWVANQTAPDHVWMSEKPADFYERDSLGNAIWEYDWTDTRSLNYDTPAVWEAQEDAMRFWLDKGVDGFRCDAAGEMPAAFWKGVLPGIKRDYPEAFERAVESICKMPQDEYVAAMAKLAAKSSVSGSESMILNEHDRARCGEALVAAANALLAQQGKKANLTLSPEAGDMRAGFLLREGDVSVNCSVEVLAELCRSEMAAKVASALFD